MPHKFQVSRDSQALYISIVAKDRLPVFQTDAIKITICKALDEARKSGGFLLFAYVQKVNYFHLNPVRAGLVERAIDYQWSSARIWQGCASDDEPLMVDINRIQWRRGA